MAHGSGGRPAAPVVCLLFMASVLAGETLPLGHPDFYPSHEHPVGFRGDWSGRYPGATPPTRWTTAYNVVWKAEVGGGESSPIVVGDRLFILTEGITLCCLRKSDGHMLWKRDRHARADLAAEAYARQIEDFVHLHREAGRSDERAKELRDRLHKSEYALRILSPGAMAYAIAVPCSDGESVYVYLPTGEVVSYSLDGERKWLRTLGNARAAGGWEAGQVGASPLLVAGRLIVHYDSVYCLDAGSGRTLWSTPVRGLPIASPVAARRGRSRFIGLGSTPILRLSDGKVIWGSPCNAQVGSPISLGDSICWMGYTMAMPDGPDGAPVLRWELSPLASSVAHGGWSKRSAAGMGWHQYSSPVLHNGVIYYHHEGRRVGMIDAATGRGLNGVPVTCGGEVYPGMSLAGDYLFISDRGGHTVVLEPVGKYGLRVVAENRLAQLGGNMFVFSGSRAYVRSGSDLYCIGDPLVGHIGGRPSASGAPTAAPDEFSAVRALTATRATAPGLVPQLAAKVSTNYTRECRMSLLSLRALGPSAAETAPRLLTLLSPAGRGRDAGDVRGLRCEVMDALAAMGPAAADAVVSAVRGGLATPRRGWDAQVLPLLLSLLAGYGRAATGAIETLRSLVGDEGRWGVLPRAAQALAAIDPDSVEDLIVPRLRSEFGMDPTGRDAERRRTTALQAAARLGRAARSLAPDLLQFAGSSNAPLPEVSAALRSVAPGTVRTELVPLLTERLCASDGNTRKCAAQILGSFREAAREAVPPLERCLQDRDRAVARAASLALYLIRHEPEKYGEAERHMVEARAVPSRRAVARVIGYCSDEDETIRFRAAVALGKIGPRAAASAPALVRLLERDELPAIYHAAEHALERVGESALPHLLRAARHESPSVRRGVASALSAHGSRRRRTVPALTAMLSDASPPVREAAVRALVRAGDSAVPRLLDTASSADPRTRRGAVDALAGIGRPVAEVVAVLVACLTDEAEDVRAGAATGLGKIGLPAVAPLITALDSDDREFRKAAMWALSEIGHDARDSVPSLIRAFEQDDDEIHDAAVSALAKIATADELPEGIVPELLRMLTGSRPVLAFRAADRLAEIGPAVMPELLKIVKEGQHRDSWRAIYALGGMGSAAQSAVPVVLDQARGRRHQDWQRIAREALDKIRGIQDRNEEPCAPTP